LLRKTGTNQLPPSSWRSEARIQWLGGMGLRRAGEALQAMSMAHMKPWMLGYQMWLPRAGGRIVLTDKA